ncbi:hypothetical protein B0O99DRAFT_649425 [Bisporella sp. PMI_857]|nr:hypothetical protein B0O99DRAFT_649425 [Bisporella sp. PMI_857]
MARLSLHAVLALCFIVASLISAQTSADSDGYIGYSLEQTGDPESVIYATNSTTPNVSTTYPPPDVFLNASVHVGEISLEVDNITAKVNLDAQVLQLLQFNAGVEASIDRVSLLIQEVNAKVLLEARLGNILLMVSNVLDSLDLNPILATLGQTLTGVVDDIGDVLGADASTASVVEKRSSYTLTHNILYSVNNYAGQTHTNRILAQNGSIIDQSVDNQGDVYAEVTVGSYLQDMTFNGYNRTVTGHGEAVRELEYVYTPFPGLEVIAGIFTNARGGGSSTVAADEELKA